jgi:hypothetical protein
MNISVSKGVDDLDNPVVRGFSKAPASYGVFLLFTDP